MSPELPINENFPAPATVALRAKGLDVLAISECCPGWDDVRVMSLALESQRWLIIRDYGDLIYLRGLPPPPAVILLRVPSYRLGGASAVGELNDGRCRGAYRQVHSF